MTIFYCGKEVTDDNQKLHNEAEWNEYVKTHTNLPSGIIPDNLEKDFIQWCKNNNIYLLSLFNLQGRDIYKGIDAVKQANLKVRNDGVYLSPNYSYWD